MWNDAWPWLVAVLVLGLTVAGLWLSLRRPRMESSLDEYDRAIERWLEGDLAGARDMLRDVVRLEPGRIQPYLQLGTLLRLTGDPGRAAAMHRSLAVREDLPHGRRAAVGLELAEDLLALSRAGDAEAVLQRIGDTAADQERWYRLRFAAALAQRQPDRALEALQEGEKRLPPASAARLRSLRAAWLADRVLRCVRAGQHDAASRYLSHARKMPEAAARVLLLRALVAADEGNEDRAVAAVAEGLAKYPAEMAPALGLLETALLTAGRFAMAVPILETACRDEASPPELWIALVQLYEKLGRRQDAMALLESKRDDPRLTPDAAASYLRLLASENPDLPVSQVLSFLHEPSPARGFRCRRCGHRTRDLQWFCANCLSPDSFEPAPTLKPPDLSENSELLASPPRY